MDIQLANEIIACLPKGRTRFDYFLDRYAAMLLSWKAGKGVSVGDVKKSCFSGLLKKPLIRHFLTSAGDGQLKADTLELLWQEPVKPYLLSLSVWEGMERWAQTSRKGVNLVLQLNFTNEHKQAFQKLIKPKMRDIYVRHGHPVSYADEKRGGRDTMAWARIDLDLDTGEALVEEIQNDWLRTVVADYRLMQVADTTPWYANGSMEEFARYHNEVILPHLKQWDEAMLAATLWFLRDEIGINRIWYHDYYTGKMVKRIGETSPPRSIYTSLPRKFCFRTVEETPTFLQQDKSFRKCCRKFASLRWQYLEV
jgi:hypothetical protein